MTRRDAGAELISVIVPAYNYGHFVGRALDSILAQTYPGWECVVVDDGSTDETASVVAAYGRRDARIRCLSQANRGISAARNAGIGATRGAYLQFLDADDLIEGRKLEQHLECLRQHPEADLVYGGARYFRTEGGQEPLDPQDEASRPRLAGVSGAGRQLLLALVRENILVVHAPLLRRRVAEAIGGFDESLEASEDWDYWLRCAARGMRFHYHDAEGARALVRLHSRSTSKSRMRMCTTAVKMRGKLRELTDDAEVLRLNRGQLARDIGTLGIEKVIEGEVSAGSRELLRAALLSPRWQDRLKWLYFAAASPLAPRRQFEHYLGHSSFPRSFAAVLNPGAAEARPGVRR